MATHQPNIATGAQRHQPHDDNIDHQGNLNLAMWLGMVSVTFITASFVATNLYLRGWSPTKFDVSLAPILKDVPYYDTLFQLLAAILLFVSGGFFTKNRWKAFNAVLALVTILFVGVLIAQFELMIRFGNASVQVATIYTPTAVIQFLVTLVCVVLCVVTGWYASFANKRRVDYFFPAAMNVWLYSIASGVVILLTEDVMSVGRFAAWCGMHLS